MDNNIPDEETLKQIKRQEDLIKLIKVIDECMESMDKLYYFARTKQILSLSNDN